MIVYIEVRMKEFFMLSVVRTENGSHSELILFIYANDLTALTEKKTPRD